MVLPLEPVESKNEATYHSLLSLIENNQQRLALIVVACDDLRLRQRVIDRYETAARAAQIRSHRIVLGTEPSLRAELAQLVAAGQLREDEAAVVTVTGAEWLLRIKLRETEEQSDLDKFFGYLQWTREGLREFRHPIILWVTYAILKELSRRAPDFWSWRKAVLRFVSEDGEPIAVRNGERLSHTPQPQPNEEPLPPLAELLAEIQQLESIAAESDNIATLYDKLGQVYVNRITSGKAANLEQERQHAIDAFQNAIHYYQEIKNKAALVNVLIRSANFLWVQSCYENAISVYQQSLTIAHEIGNYSSEASSLRGLGNAYEALGRYQQAIDFYQQSLEIEREIGDRSGEATSLGNLGAIYLSLGQYERAIDLHQQDYEISREIGDRRGEAYSLNNLGNAYFSLGQYQRALDFHQQSLEIRCEINDRRGEATSLDDLGSVYFSLGQYQKAIDFHQQSLEIKREIGDRREEATSLGNLGNPYYALGQYQQAIYFYQQQCEIAREIGHLDGEANSLNNLGLAYNTLGQYQRAIDFYQQSLEIQREIDDRNGEAASLNGLGIAYQSLGQYQRAIDFYQQSLEIRRDIGDRNGEANSLFNKALALAKYEPRRFEALATLQQARAVYTELQLDHKVESCDEAIYDFNRIIATEQRQSAPDIPQPKPLPRRKINWLLWFGGGVAIVLLIAWLRK